MKIIYLTNARIPTEKAHGYQICKMCEEFSNLGVEVELWLPSRKNHIKVDPFSFYGIKNNFKINIINSFDFYQYNKYLRGFDFWLNGFWFLLHLLFIKIDKKSIIYTRDPEIGWLFSLRGYKTIYEAHTWPENRVKLYKFLFKNINKIVTVTNGLKKIFIEVGYPEIGILAAPDGVSLDEFNIDLDKVSAREKLNLPPDKKIIIYAGHLYGWKGAQDLAEAADLIGGDSLVIFVGGVDTDAVSFKEKNQRLIASGKIAVYPHQRHDLMPVWMKAADVLALPNKAGENISKYFTSPLKLFEYMAAGRPIVASNLPSITEILNESNSILVESDKPASLAKGVKKILENEALAESLAKQAMADVQNFSWQKRAENILNFIS
ncbi:MAG: glycosyltransferase family 4 protein [bacterium]|nr:glycosyltransferase family 4 protein [bacterium]